MTAPEETPQPGPYAAAAGRYWAAGWRGILPLPARAKKPVPKGYTGADGIMASYPDVYAWVEGPEGAGNLALRMPHHVIGLDVDNYDAKPGGHTLQDAETKWGPLPATWRSTSRDDGVSGIRLYRIPEGLAWPGVLGPGIEIIQHRHRYTVAWPSIHPDTGRTYRWIHPDGTVVLSDVPTVDELPDLPTAWIEGLSDGLARDIARADLTDTAAAAWMDRRGGRPGDRPCRAVGAALTRYIGDLTKGSSARHDTALQATSRLAHMAAEGHPGVVTALAAFKATWRQAIGADAHREEDRGEWDRLLVGAIRIAATDPEGDSDPCDNPFHGLIKDPRPGETTWPSGSPTPTAPSTGVSPATASPDGAASPLRGTPLGTPSSASPAEPAPTDDLTEQALLRQQLLTQEIERQRAQRAARRLLEDEEAAKAFREPTWRPSLIEELAIPDEPITYLVDQIMPTGANVLLTAQFKAGKTTTINHLTHCLADGQPFLGKYDVSALSGRIALWNYEVDERQYRRWLRDLNIADAAKITALNLRGYRLPLVVPRIEDWIVRWLEQHQIQVWVVDPFARAFTGSGDSENDNTEVGRFLDTLDVIKHRAGVSELIMPTHTGRAEQTEGQERARGATRLDDWADVRWLLTKDDEDLRYFRATGRDVDVPEGRLDYIEATRGLVLAGGSRKDRGSAEVADAVLRCVKANPGCGVTQLRAYVRNDLGKARNEAVDQAVRHLEQQGRLRVDRPGVGLPNRHYLDDITDLITPGGTA